MKLPRSSLWLSVPAVMLVACGSSVHDVSTDTGTDASEDGDGDAPQSADGADSTANGDSGPDATVEASAEASAEAGDAGCVIDLHGGPLTQTAARVGAFYFDGWSGGLNDYHLSQLIPGVDGKNREPLSGWEDGTACEVEQQTAWAASYGVSFFFFDWFYPPYLNNAGCNGQCWYLDNAFLQYRQLANRHGVGFAINYVDQGFFTVSPSDWPDAVSRWADLFTDPDYVLVNGKPLFMIIDVYQMLQTFGGVAQVQAALDTLRAAAQQRGLPGVYVVGGIDVPTASAFRDDLFPSLATWEAGGYDAFSMYSIGPVLPAGTGPQPFSIVTQTSQWVWNQTLAHTSLPVIPVATIGWDERPENFQEAPSPPLSPEWFDPSPQDLSGLVRTAIDWVEANPVARAEPSPTPPLVFIDAWNELLEGSELVPTVSRQHTMGDAVAADLARGSDRTRTVISLQATPASDAPPYLAYGTVQDSSGNALSGQVSVSVTPVEGAGVVGRYTATGFVPTNASVAFVAVQANISNDQYGPGPAQVVLYETDYEQTGDSVSRVTNGDFSAGATGWSFVGPAGYVAGLDGGVAVAIDAGADVLAYAAPPPFPVTPDAGFTVGFTGRVAPLSARNGEFFLAFHDDAGAGIAGTWIPFQPATAVAGTVSTTAGGQYTVDVTSFGTGKLSLGATYAGDAMHWPAYARVLR